MRGENKFEIPSRKDVLVLRLLIITGFLTMVFFFAWLMKGEHFGETPLYYLLIFVMLFSALKVVAEWYHYFNIKVPVTPEVDRTYTVDVFTTFCAGEPMEMIEETLRAIKAIQYPHESYLCDESNDPYLKEFCRKLGVHHVTRVEKKDAKAGNINNALKQSKGEICVILDPDHVPQPDFLDTVIPHFSDPETGFVQIVQAYKNIRDSIVSRGAAQQTFQFYGPMMMSMNSYGTVLAIGANCTFRREALDSIGGHAPGLAEDMHTAMKLHAKGWKSVYVPKILARGLVPSSLYAYYKQQLKWSRGVFELLFTTYIKLFRSFTWRQKMHYGTLPLHYFSGVVYMVNFLIPVLALVFAVIPLKVDLIEFLLIGMFFFATTLLIRHYVQRWVMEEGERGFHLIGGILQIGTWWVHSLGFFYSILRKKVPYIPTPKDGEEGNNFLLNLPNIIVAVISLIAIVYGISIDYNPYTFVMAGLAATNCLFMAFMVLAGQHGKISSFKVKYKTQKLTRGYVQKLRQLFWNIKHDTYAVLRKIALPVSLGLTLISIVAINRGADPGTITKVKKKGSFYTGIFSPDLNGAFTTMAAINREERYFNTHFDLVSHYIAWGDQDENTFPKEALTSTVKNGSYPFITWEPWVSTFLKSSENVDLKNEKLGLRYIANGEFDDYIKDFGFKLKDLNSPVFLRFAHEPENPFYPWSESGGNTAEDFVNCWRHVHGVFDSLGIDNVIWVWSPWKAENLSAYFPGEDFVDWIGVTGLNYGSYNPDGKWYEFEELYTPFALDSIFQKDLPVIIAEFGSLTLGGDQEIWLKNALEAIENKFPEIKGLIYFNSGIDQNVPGDAVEEEALNWKVVEVAKVSQRNTASINGQERKILGTQLELITPVKDSSVTRASVNYSQFFSGVKGINYRKGNKWFRNFYALTFKEIDADFRKIKDLGANTIKWCGPGIYDKNILAASKKHGLNIHYSFWIANDTDFLKDRKVLEKMSGEILKTVTRYKHHPSIKSWNIGNDTWHSLENNYYKPDVFNQRNAYLAWLKSLVTEISKIDDRPVTVDLLAAEDLQFKGKTIIDLIPEIAAFGLIYNADEPEHPNLLEVDFPTFESDISVELVSQKGAWNGGFISSFQDLGTPDYVSFTGLVDHKQRLKDSYFLLKNLWTSDDQRFSPYIIKILKDAHPVEPDRKMRYSAIIKEEGSWSLADEHESIKFYWHLIRTDGYGNGVYMNYLGEGAKMYVNPPADYKNYEILLTADVGSYVVQYKTQLHTPLINSN